LAALEIQAAALAPMPTPPMPMRSPRRSQRGPLPWSHRSSKYRTKRRCSPRSAAATVDDAAVSEPAFRAKPWSPGRPDASAEMAPRAERPAPQPEPPKDGFDLVWPDRTGPAGSPVSEAAKREPALDMRCRPSSAACATASLPIAVRRGPAKQQRARTCDPQVRRDRREPYTLYADGSIEAELPQGTVKFSSVDALRSHLENRLDGLTGHGVTKRRLQQPAFLL